MRARHAAALLGLSLILVSSSAGQAAPARTEATQPFKYLFRVTALTMTSTLTYQQSKATTSYRLERPSESRWLTYLGRKPLPGARPRQTAAPVLPAVATATYSSSDPACTQTIEFRPSKRRPLQARLFLTHTWTARVRVRVSMDNVPLAAPAPGKDSGDPRQTGRCGKPVFDWFDNAAYVAPASVLAKPSFTMTFQRQERFTDPGIESIDWTVKMVVQRVRYRPINCATEPGC